MGAATPYTIGARGPDARLNLYQFTLASVPLSQTGSEEEITAIPMMGTIKQVKIASPTSTDFDVTIFNKTGASANTNNVVLKIEGINLHYDEAELDITYRNADTTIESSLYCIVKNDDGGNATGAITVELFIDILGEE